MAARAAWSASGEALFVCGLGAAATSCDPAGAGRAFWRSTLVGAGAITCVVVVVTPLGVFSPLGAGIGAAGMAAVSFAETASAFSIRFSSWGLGGGAAVGWGALTWLSDPFPLSSTRTPPGTAWTSYRGLPIRSATTRTTAGLLSRNCPTRTPFKNTDSVSYSFLSVALSAPSMSTTRRGGSSNWKTL